MKQEIINSGILDKIEFNDINIIDSEDKNLDYAFAIDMKLIDLLK